ncbi:MAG: VOC family protein [Rhodovibrionaceae bacterium]
MERKSNDSLRVTAAGRSSGGGDDSLVRGVHHLVLTTEDMKETIDFYMAIFGMQLVHGFKTGPGVAAMSSERGNPPFEGIRHYFMDMGNDSVLAFFEFPKGKVGKNDRNTIGGMQHVSFCVEDGAEFEELQRRLRENDVPYYGPIKMTSGPGYSIYFFDPSGARIEASCDPDGEATKNIISHITQSKEELLSELRTLCSDEVWLEKVTAALPD